MNIKKILVPFTIQEKIVKKHKVFREELEAVFFDEPYFFKTRNDNYYAIGFIGEYVTVVFKFDEGQAIITTAYRSSEWQKNLYKRKCKK